jgi:hypothetical protein
MYTTEYTQHLELMAAAKIAFDKNPCKTTATKLSNLRQKNVTMYTPEEQALRKNSRDQADKEMWVELWGYMSDIKAGL